jgi:TRAP-type C4-dicarboxylate transport system permease small subunit
MSTSSRRRRNLFEARRARGIRPELVIEIPAIAVMFIMMLHISANALLRAFVRAPVADTLEITQYWYMPVIVFIGFVAAQMRGEHVTADFVYNLLPMSVRPYVLGVGYVLVTVVCGGFAWFGWEEAITALEVRRVAGASNVPAWPTYFLAPLSFAVLTLQFAVVSVQSFRGRAIAEPNELNELEVV